jgi:hypothetical protein
MLLSPSTPDDIEQLTEWIKNDPYHKDCLDPLWWLTGQGVLSYCIQDNRGPTMYVRIDLDMLALRIHTQFAPLAEVSKVRVVRSLLWALPRMKPVAVQNGCNSYVFNSTSPDLIEFMKKKFGFVSVGGGDYAASIEGI